VVDALLDWGDVVVHNFRPAVAERLHLDAEHTRAGRPRLIHVAIDGFGPAGPTPDVPPTTTSSRRWRDTRPSKPTARQASRH
jgi:crotonobetainyl-CoA:carnitine CoA-transferase CaiB-like acyl-CoA transferase